VPNSVRTRFAPSPTGDLHLGSARTALFAWAYAKHHAGSFALRIEDTDVERSTPAAVQTILEAMEWLGLSYDEGPVYQMRRMDRYRTILARMLTDGRAYRCYCTPEELESMREAQRARGEKPRYDGRWRPERGRPLPAPVPDIEPVVRFRNPLRGTVTWDDLVKGEISISNEELDDLVLARRDGTPTYNFCVCVDDWDMGITHVIRGDDHVNNTPRQINILKSLGADIPQYAHVPMISGPDGEKLSKRHGAVSVLQYREEGYLPEAMINYLARLGWSHGDEELFSPEQFVEWFDTGHLTRSPAQWDPKKLDWVNHHHISTASLARLAELTAPFIARAGGTIAGAPLEAVVALLKDRANTLVQLAQAAMMFYGPFAPDPLLVAQHVDPAARRMLAEFADEAASITWSREAIDKLIQHTIARHAVKMPQLAIPLRVLVVARTQTPAISSVLELVGQSVVVERIRKGLAAL